MLSFPTSPKQPGLCSCCDVPVFNIVKKWDDNHPLAKEIRTVGDPLDMAVVLGLVTLSGACMEVSFCSNCADQFSEEDIPGLWDRISVSNERELTDSYRAAVGVKPLLPNQVIEMKYFYLQNTPIGILYKAPWRMKK